MIKYNDSVPPFIVPGLVHMSCCYLARRKAFFSWPAQDDRIIPRLLSTRILDPDITLVSDSNGFHFHCSTPPSWASSASSRSSRSLLLLTCAYQDSNHLLDSLTRIFLLKANVPNFPDSKSP